MPQSLWMFRGFREHNIDYGKVEKKNYIPNAIAPWALAPSNAS